MTRLLPNAFIAQLPPRPSRPSAELDRLLLLLLVERGACLKPDCHRPCRAVRGHGSKQPEMHIPILMQVKIWKYLQIFTVSAASKAIGPAFLSHAKYNRRVRPKFHFPSS